MAMALEPDRQTIQVIRDALVHLYDLPYLQTHPLARARPARSSGASVAAGRELQRFLIDALADLGGRTTAADRPLGRRQELLRLRYVEALDPTAVWRQLGIGKSQYYHEHADALRALASHVVERVATIEPPSSPPAPTGRRSLGNLPTTVSRLFGRAEAITEVRRLLDDRRLVTLTGAGGVGKTRLAVEVARQRPDAFPDGIWLVELAAVVDGGLVVSMIRRAIGVDARLSSDSAGLRAALRDRHALIVLDNCEQIRDACAAITADLVSACPNLRILATSRERLGVVGEAVWRVPSLETPPGWLAVTAADVLASPSGQLFLDRARLARTGFDVTDSGAATVGAICRRLDGIPLAIELAAAWVRVLTPVEIAARLDDRFALLTDRQRVDLPRHRSLRATLDWSHDLLAESERRLLRRLTVFRGGWTLAAATAVCADADLPVESILDRLTSLIDRSLVEAETDGETTRYRMLETVHSYAGERLETSGEAPARRARHLAWCLSAIERAPIELAGPNQVAWYDMLTLEIENARAALAWARADPGGAGAELRMVAALGRFLSARGYLEESRAWLDHALARADAAPSPERSEALNWAGVLAQRRGDLATSRALLEEALAGARGRHPTRLETLSRRHLAITLISAGDHTEAAAHLEAALTIATAAGDRREAAFAAFQLGTQARRHGDRDRMSDLLARALADGRASGDSGIVAHTLLLLGGLALSDGDAGRARACAEEARALLRRRNVRSGIIDAERSLAILDERAGCHDAADARLREALTIALETHDEPQMAGTLLLCGRFLQRRGLAASALRLLGAAAGSWATYGHWPDPWRREILDEDLPAARAAVGADADALFASGTALGVRAAAIEAIGLLTGQT